MKYFDHDTSASMDEKIMQLRLMHGGAAVDAYWYLLEQIYKAEEPLCVCNANALRLHMHILCLDQKTLETYIQSMIEVGLFIEVEGEVITSERAQNNVKKYQEKSTKASTAASKRWDCKRNANAMQTHSERNANEKEKEKENNNKEKINKKEKTRHKYGLYENVLLTDDDFSKLKSEFPNDWENRIENLSEYIAKKGDKYKNHLAVIRSWAKNDQNKASPQANAIDYTDFWGDA